MDKPETPLHDQIVERLAQHGLAPPEADIPGLAPMITEIATASKALRRQRSFAQEPTNVFSLARFAQPTKA